MQSTVPLSAQCNQCTGNFQGGQSPLPHHVSGKTLSQHAVSILILSYAETYCGFGQTISAAKSGPECRLHAVQFINSSKFLPSCRLHIIDQARNAELPLCVTCIDLWGQAAPLPIEGE